MKKSITVLLVVLAAVLILAIIVVNSYAAPPDFIPPGHRGTEGRQPSATAISSSHATAIAGANATAIQGQQQGQIQSQTATGGQGIGSVNVTGPTQGITITPSPTVVQESQRVIPGTLPYKGDTYIPPLQPQALENQQEPVMRGRTGLFPLKVPGANVSLWKQDGAQFSLDDIDTGDDACKGITVDYLPTKQTADTALRAKKATGKMTIHKPNDAMARAKMPAYQPVGTGLATADTPRMTFARIERCVMQFAKQQGATEVIELDRYITSVTNSKGFNLNAQLGVSAIGTLLGQNAVYGPMVGAAYQALTANLEDRKYVEFELER